MTGRLPVEIDTMPYLDSLSLIESHYRHQRRDIELQAALAGKRLR